MGYVELLKRARRQEVTNEWCRTKYKSVAAHAILNLQRLWLLAGCLAVVTLLLPQYVFTKGVRPAPLEVTCNADNPDRLEFTKHGPGSDQVDLSEVVLADWDKLFSNLIEWGWVDQSTIFQNLDWMEIDFGPELKSEQSRTFVLILYPRDEDRESIVSSHKWLMDPPLRLEQYPYDLNDRPSAFGGTEIIKLDSRKFEERGDGDEKKWVYQMKEVFLLTNGFEDSDVCPGVLEVVLVPTTGECAQMRAWEIEEATVTLQRKYAVPYTFAARSLGLKPDWSGEYPYVEELAQMRMDGVIEDEHDRIKELPSPVPVVARLLSVLATLMYPLLAAGILACLVACLGARRSRRPFRDVYATSAHFLISVSAIFFALHVFIAPLFFVQEGIVMWLVLVFFLLPILYLGRFLIFHLPLQLAAASGQVVNWQARSLILGFRKSFGLHANFFRLVGLALVFGYAVWFLKIRVFEVWLMLEVLPKLLS